MPSNLDTLPNVGAPATRALAEHGYRTLRDVAGASRRALLDLRDVGPRAVRILEAALAEHGRVLRD
jgi:hypothetical protein